MTPAGLVVRQHESGRFWDVVHEDSGLKAAGYLRQRRFAEQARAEFAALGIDWTRPKDEVRPLLARPGAAQVHRRWWDRARTPANDPTTHEYYSASLRVGTRPNSAARAAQLRAADRRDVTSDPGGPGAWGTDGGR